STPPPLSRRKAVSNGPRSLTFAALFPLTPGETHEEGFVPARRTFFGRRCFRRLALVGQGRRQAGPHPLAALSLAFVCSALVPSSARAADKPAPTPAPAAAKPAAAPAATAAEKPAPAGVTTATWWGHAAWIITTPGGATIAIDPWLDNPSAPK